MKQTKVDDFSEIQLSQMTPELMIGVMYEFFNHYPDYATQFSSLIMMSNILNNELKKFMMRPHKKVTTEKYVLE